MVKSVQIRAAKEMNKIIREIQIDFIKKGKTPPSQARITKAIIKKFDIKKEDFINDQFTKI